MGDLQPECDSKRSHTITRNMQYKIKNTAIKVEAIVTKKKNTHTQTQKAMCDEY